MGKAMDERAKSEHDGSDTVPAADLAAVAAQIAEEFPLVLEQTSLVLLDVDPDHLHAFWTLAPNDVARADAAFPAGGGAAEPVIRLRRLHADGAAEVLTTLPMTEGPQGDARFAVANDDATYQAEFGLRNGHGGWVLLARSNQTRLPRPVGIPIPRWAGEERPAAIPQPAGLSPDGAPSVPGTVPQSTEHAGTDVLGGTQPPPVPPPAGAPEPLPSPGTRSARWVLAMAAADGTEAARPITQATPEGTSMEGGADLHTNPPPADEIPLARAWQPAIPVDWHWTSQAEPFPETASAPDWGVPDLPGSARPSPAPVAAAPAQPEPPGPISSFALGRGPGAPVVEAEVLVHVSASPGTLVDLYGRPLRIGPSGRSTLRFPVTDLDKLEGLLGRPADPEGPTGRD
jgi:hypothetical protein